MRYLLLNTCGAAGLVALAEGDQVIAEEWLPGRGASEALLRVVRGLMEGKSWRVSELGAVGVVAGPGSFTGMRVGLSAAKGLCEASGAGLVAMSRLALVGDFEIPPQTSSEMGHPPDTVIPPQAVLEMGHPQTIAVLDAGRGEYYCGAELDGERVVSGDEVRRISFESRLVSCEENVVKGLDVPVKLVREPGGAEMLAMLRRRITAGEWSDVALEDANYLRRTDAELKARTDR